MRHMSYATRRMRERERERCWSHLRTKLVIVCYCGVYSIQKKCKRAGNTLAENTHCGTPSSPRAASYALAGLVSRTVARWPRRSRSSPPGLGDSNAWKLRNETRSCVRTYVFSRLCPKCFVLRTLDKVKTSEDLLGVWRRPVFKLSAKRGEFNVQ